MKKQLAVGILAHVDAGKTTLSEALLYTAGTIRTLGRVDHRDSFLDTHELERARGITIFSKQARLETEQAQITLVDTPGHMDFSAETERTLQILDCAVLVISGTDGVQAHTETLWRLLERYHVPTFVFVTKMDLTGADRAARLAELKQRLHPGCTDFALPDEQRREEAATCDESVLERVLEGGTVTDEDISRMIGQRTLIPVRFGSGLKLEGVDALLNDLSRFARMPKYPERFGAKVYKITRDEQGKRLTWLKVTGGTLTVRMPLTFRVSQGDGTQEVQEKISGVRLYSGSRYESADRVEAGGICAVTGLTKTFPGQGLGITAAGEAPLLEPVLNYRVQLPPDCDPRTMLAQLRQLEEEDPQLHPVWNETLKEIHVQLMGEVQIEVLKSIIKSRFGVEVNVDEGRILYKETIAAPVEGVGHFEPLRHYAEVHLALEPLPRGTGLEFDTVCPTDELDLNWQRLILTHLEEKNHLGVLTGAPVTDIRFTLLTGRAHLKHTEGGDFRQATYRAVRQGLMRAESVLLEPYYSFRMEVPVEQVGRAITDIRTFCGKFENPEPMGEMSVLCGTAPVSTLRGYQTELLAYTRGRGRLSCSVEGYMPCHNTEEVRASLGYDPEADVENTPDSVFCAHGSGFNVKWDRVPEYMHLDTGFGQPKEVQTAAPARVRTANLNLDEKELEAIWKKAFGEIRRPQYSAPTRPKVTLPDRVSVKPGCLIVDGYNIIFAWEELKKQAKVDLEQARLHLLDEMVAYHAVRHSRIVVVFDGYRVKGNSGTTEDYHGVQVVYTKEGETADLYMEQLVQEIGRNHSVRVATGDGLIQLTTLRSGVLRMSARELREELDTVRDEINAFLSSGS